MRVTPSAQVAPVPPDRGAIPITRFDTILLAATVLLAVILLAGGAQAQVSDRTTGTAASIWNHNGSLMSLELAGGQLRFAYVQPRPGMIDAGARTGSGLFEGRLQATRISGLARVFVWQCGQFPYQVEGEVTNDGTHITLKGLAPWVERATYALKGSAPDVLNFDLKWRTDSDGDHLA
jgi:hypothetical protein